MQTHAILLGTLTAALRRVHRAVRVRVRVRRPELGDHPRVGGAARSVQRADVCGGEPNTGCFRWLRSPHTCAPAPWGTGARARPSRPSRPGQARTRTAEGGEDGWVGAALERGGRVCGAVGVRGGARGRRARRPGLRASSPSRRQGAGRCGAVRVADGRGGLGLIIAV